MLFGKHKKAFDIWNARYYNVLQDPVKILICWTKHLVQ